MNQPFLALTGVSKAFGTNTVISDIDLTLEKGEFVSFLGPSGCGKTTVLRMVAGFEQPSRGTIHIDGQDMTAMPTRQRRLGMVFQSYALFPNMTVADNIAFGLKVAGMARPDRDRRVAEMLELIGLGTLGKRYAFELSGGQQQRVALARALAPRPRMLLLDEPLSALDAKIRVSLRDQIRAIQRELQITTIFVTHDQEEALSISDRVVVMNRGRIDQVGPPVEIYNAPATAFVAQFVGELNTLSARMVDAATGTVRIGGETITTPKAVGLAGRDDALHASLRPEAVLLGGGGPGRVMLRGHLKSVAFLGPITRLGVAVDGDMVFLDRFNDRRPPGIAIGDALDISFDPADIVAFSRS